MIASTMPAPVTRILVVDDDADLREQIAHYLADQGYCVDEAKDAEEMDRALSTGGADVLILDLMLPGEDGLSICRRVKRSTDAAVVMLSAMGEDTDRIVGLELGADDYLAKPCAPRELLARVRAVLRTRNQPPKAADPRNPVYSFFGFRLDVVRRQLHAPNGVAILLTAGEFSLLRAFLDRPNRVLTRDELIDAARGQDADVFDRAVDVQMSRLRRKLASCTDRDMIRTLRGAGYLFSGAVAKR